MLITVLRRIFMDCKSSVEQEISKKDLENTTEKSFSQKLQFSLEILATTATLPLAVLFNVYLLVISFNFNCRKTKYGFYQIIFIAFLV